MASKTFYFLDALATGSNYLQLQDGGSPPGQARVTTGWVVSNTAATVYSNMDSQTERAATTLTGTALPNQPPFNALGDSFRTQDKYLGNFALGNWGFDFQVEGETRATSTTDGRLRVRVWRSANADGSSAVEITTGTAITTSQFVNLANDAFQNITGTASLKAFSLTNEYLFFQVALQVDGAGNNVNADVHLAIGAGNHFDSTDFVSTGPQNATLNSTLGSATASSSGKVATSSSLSKTLDSITKSLSGSVAENSSLSKTLGDITLASSGTVETPVQTNSGALDVTLGALSEISTGVLDDYADLSKTLGDVTLSSNGTVANPVVYTAEAFGEQNPTNGEEPVSWQTWSDGAGGTPSIIGDTDWGKLNLTSGEEGRSAVYNIGTTGTYVLTLTENRYGSGTGTATLQIRGDTLLFSQDAVLPAWEDYTIAVSKYWNYVQARLVAP